MKLNVMALALACGLIWGLGILFMTWFVIALDGSTGEITVLSRVYRGYNISLGGSIIGMGWGLVDGFLGGLVLAGLYNQFLPKPKPAE